jgi:hypothetical protein
VTLERAAGWTLTRLILGDMILNWFLGIALIAFPGSIDALLGMAPILPLLIYRLIGLGFLGFAAWQLVVVRRGRIGPPGLVFAAAMALGPVIALTIALVAMRLPLRPIWRLILWAGNAYMLLLTAWYLFVARWMGRDSRGAPG